MPNRCMNDVLYQHLIANWLPIKSRPILQKKDMWIAACRRAEIQHWSAFFADICIHTGSACDRRICICKYFSSKDKSDCYNRHYRYGFT